MRHKGKLLIFFLTILALVIPVSSFSENGSKKSTLIELLDSAVLAIQGKVKKVGLPGRDRICVTLVQVDQVIKGDVKNSTLKVAEALMFPSDQPSYRKDTFVTLFLTALPDYSRYNGYRAKGIQYMALGNGAGIKKVSGDSIKTVDNFLTQYIKLATFQSDEEKRKYFSFLLGGLSASLDLINEASVKAIVEIDNLSSLIRKQDIPLFKNFINNTNRSSDDRGQLMLALSGLSEFDTFISATIKKDPKMMKYAIRCLKSVENKDKANLDILELCLKDPNSEVKLEALGYISKELYPKTEIYIGALALHDPSETVRTRALGIIGEMGGKSLEKISTLALQDPSPLVVYTAADEIRKLNKDDSARTLEGLLQKDDPRLRFIGIIMLGTMKGEEAHRILKEASNTHTDQKTRDFSAKLLRNGPLDMNSVRQLLGVNNLP